MWYSIKSEVPSRFHARECRSYRIDRLFQLHSARALDQNNIAFFQRSREQVTRLERIAQELQSRAVHATLLCPLQYLFGLALDRHDQFQSRTRRFMAAIAMKFRTLVPELEH